MKIANFSTRIKEIDHFYVYSKNEKNSKLQFYLKNLKKKECFRFTKNKCIFKESKQKQ